MSENVSYYTNLSQHVWKSEEKKKKKRNLSDNCYMNPKPNFNHNFNPNHNPNPSHNANPNPALTLKQL